MAASTESRVKSIEDRIMVYLRKARSNPFRSDNNTPASVRIIAQDLDMPQEVVDRTCRKLAHRGLLEKIQVGGHYPYYRI